MVRNQVRIQVRYKATTHGTSWVDCTETYSNYIRNKPKGPVSVRKHMPK